MSTTDFGPVEAIHYNPAFEATATADGVAMTQWGGALPLAAAQTLWEYVNSRANRSTTQGHTGVRDVITSPSPVIAPWNGWYVIESFVFRPYKFSNGTLAAEFDMTAAYLGPA